MLASECSSGCESGWTLYFEHSVNPSQLDPAFLDEKRVALFDTGANEKRADQGEEEEQDEEEEEDLSMVSDASSGPPHFHEEEDQDHEGYSNNGSGGFNSLYPKTEDSIFVKSRSNKRKKERESHNQQKYKAQELCSFLDDTASSPMMDFFPNNEYILTNTPASMESLLQYSSHGFSATEFEGSSGFQDQLGILEPPHSSGRLHSNQWHGRRRMEFR